ncbi:flagellar motor switch protein FliN [Desulfatitalea alkaliphila]|uniref:Flagellar motor switch protein FliN n=1 Tax=Desulfatitalea alkaliphila TaxID=2929485 RepID=A0AA41UJM0_9BACT|nr:flagellar motor switch protein FliN [Desulfatitalea alkaliphila]MCJ8501299.1 flagellar motor switch protein FliN [Desulfatitalea alkaliphila]
MATADKAQVEAGHGAGDVSRTSAAKAATRSDGGRPNNLDFILDIPLEISVELGRTRMMIHDLLKLGQGSVIELTKNAGETLEIMANNRLIAKGDVVVVNDKYGIRLTEVISPVERLEKLK